MHWYRTHRADARARRLADRHYSRQTPYAAQFAPPGRCVVLLTKHADAVWVSSWPQPQYVKRIFPSAWLCTLFRNESSVLSSTLIGEAVAATRFVWGEPPADGMITFVDAAKVRSPNPGYCFKQAGFCSAGRTKSGLIVLHLAAEAMPEAAPVAPISEVFQLSLFDHWSITSGSKPEVIDEHQKGNEYEQTRSISITDQTDDTTDESPETAHGR
jgi:hypothetical protein